ncbi:discoidin domain-containing protein [Neomoorella thermoacetica]|nr:discoidin domain-containing protein [Moorella thermoacetica]
MVSSTGYYGAGKIMDLSGGTGGTGGQTVYTAPNGVVVTSSVPVYTTSSNSAFYYMSYLFDGTITQASTQYTTYWLTDSSGNQTLTFDFGTLGNPGIGGIVVYPRTRDDASSNYRILVSDDDVNYTEIVPWVVNTHDAATPYGTRRKHEVNISSRYVRFELTSNGPYTTLSEIEFYTGTGTDVGFKSYTMAYAHSLWTCLYVNFLPYVPYASSKNSYPVQYLMKVEPDYIILAVQGAYQVDVTARTHIAYVGRLGTPANSPPAYAAATTLGTANLTATLSDNRRASVQSTYNVYSSQVPVSPDIQNRFALVPIYVYRPDENWRGWFKDLYVAEIPPQTMLNGETVTAQDGSKYTFFNIPPSGDGYYNNFLASGDTNKWLVVRH